MAELSYHISDGERKKNTLCIPESHTFYLCPRACGRRQGIRAIKNGIKQRVSFLMFSEEDVISGAYEQSVIEAVEELIELLDCTPRVILLYVNCIDDFLNTDEKYLINCLDDAFPKIQFLLSHINPIAADLAKEPASAIHARLYELLCITKKHDRFINLVGNFEQIPSESEWEDFLAYAGWEGIRHLDLCKTYAEYLAMADSELTISLSHIGDMAAMDMTTRLGIPHLIWHASYDLNTVADRYRELFSLSKISDEILRPYINQTRQEIHDTQKCLEGRLIAVDSSASRRPFSLACTLLDYGFKVFVVFALHQKDPDKEAREKLSKKYPEVVVITHEAHEAITGYDINTECISIGKDAAFLLQQQNFIDMHNDEGYFGFYGISKLMKKLRAARNSSNFQRSPKSDSKKEI